MDSFATVSRINVDARSGASLFPTITPYYDEYFVNEARPNALVIYADPREDTLTAAVRNTMVDNLHQEGWDVVVHNLYAEEFDPVASAEEVSYGTRLPGEVDDVISEHQRHIAQADALVLIYPLWWKQPPAILKGWQDRVFTYGFAYEFVQGATDSVISLLPGKKVLLINIVAGSEEIYRDQGYLRYLDIADRSLYGISGMELTGRHVIYSATGMDQDEKQDCLDELATLTLLLRSDMPSFR